jgi:hypothetical protein
MEKCYSRLTATLLYLVGGLEHFFSILGITIPTDSFFRRGRYTTNQVYILHIGMVIGGDSPLFCVTKNPVNCWVSPGKSPQKTNGCRSGLDTSDFYPKPSVAQSFGKPWYGVFFVHLVFQIFQIFQTPEAFAH